MRSRRSRDKAVAPRRSREPWADTARRSGESSSVTRVATVGIDHRRRTIWRAGDGHGHVVTGGSRRRSGRSLGHASRRSGARSNYVMIGKRKARTVEATNQRARSLINRAPRRIRTVTVDNGTEFHGYQQIEVATVRRSISLHRITLGNVGPARTPTDSSVSIYPSEPAWLASLSATALASPTRLTTDRENVSPSVPHSSVMSDPRWCTSNLNSSRGVEPALRMFKASSMRPVGGAA